MKSTHSSLRAFTLIELLTVIAIIGILAAIIIPVTGKVRTTAKAASCRSNLKQLGAAFLLYADENKDVIPPGLISGNPGPSNNWMYYLAPYTVRKGEPDPGSFPAFQHGIAEKPPFLCPSVDITATGTNSWLSYKISNQLQLKGRSMLVPPRRIYTTSLMEMRRLINPARTFLLADGWQGDTRFSVYAESTGVSVANSIRPSVHDGKANTLFADGHVESLSEAELGAKWDLGYTNIVQ